MENQGNPLNEVKCHRVMCVCYVPSLSLAWPGRWHCLDKLHPHTQGGGGPGSHHHLPDTETERVKIAKLKCWMEAAWTMILCSLKQNYFNISIPSECFGFVLEATQSTGQLLATKENGAILFFPHMWAGSQEHLLVSYEQTSGTRLFDAFW